MVRTVRRLAAVIVSAVRDEARVLVTARKFGEMQHIDQEIAAIEPATEEPRLLGAPELSAEESD